MMMTHIIGEGICPVATEEAPLENWTQEEELAVKVVLSEVIGEKVMEVLDKMVRVKMVHLAEGELQEESSMMELLMLRVQEEDQLPVEELAEPFTAQVMTDLMADLKAVLEVVMVPPEVLEHSEIPMLRQMLKDLIKLTIEEVVELSESTEN